MAPNKLLPLKQPPAASARKKEKLDRVSALVRRLWPKCSYIVAIWHPPKTQDGRSFVELITNADMAELGGLLRDTADHIDKTTALGSDRPRGNA